MPDLGLNHRGPNGLPPVLILPQSKYTGIQGDTERSVNAALGPGSSPGRAAVYPSFPAKAGIQG